MSKNKYIDIKHGSLIISLDLELMWGVRDVTTFEQYGKAIKGVRQALPNMLSLFEKYNIKATFSTVGLLFFDNKKEMLANLPTLKPSYNNPQLSPYSFIKEIGNNETEDPYHYGSSLIQLIINKNQEISTHTFCHYYCLEEGQNIDTFKEDIKAAISIAKKHEIKIKSIIFPRNQFNSNYLKVCKELGITSYRGNEQSWIYKPSKANDESLFKRFFRLLDSYINISGYHIYDYSFISSTIPYNIPSSAFLRPYSKKLSVLRRRKLSRIKKGMSLAAKQNKVYHLWWHPHNFGVNQNENMQNLNELLVHYEMLNKKYNFQSLTMSGLVNKLFNNL